MEIKEFLTQVQEGQANVVNVAKKMLGDKETVSFELINRKEVPIRAESDARSHIFHTAAGFCKYVEKNKTDNTLVIADSKSEVVYAALDEKATNGFEVVTLEPPYHPIFQLLHDTILTASPMSIHEFAKNLMRNRQIIVPTEKLSARDIALLMQQITVSSRITACSGAGKDSVNGVMCHTTVKAGLAETPAEIPDEIRVKCPIWLDTDEVEFGIDITVASDRTGERVTVDIDAPELAIRQSEVFAAILEDIDKLDVLKVDGSYNVRPWQYI